MLINHAALAALLFASGATLAQTVKISDGALQGGSEQGVEFFKGIPYAQPPVGDLRWRAPQPVKPWGGVLEAKNYGHDCAQQPFPGDAAPLLNAVTSEDCLVLNVWRPASPAEKALPVMVWIHGGGFVNGGASPAVYDGSEFARQGVIFVSLNYRLGRFGFFAHPALQQDALKGNYGLMDQIAALHWVQRHIADFGGDKNNVTVFGESAGGFSVISLLTTPEAKGLFSKAIIQSGSGRQNITPGLSWQQAQNAGVAFAKRWGIEGEGGQALAALRALPADKLVDGLNMATMNRPDYSGPMIDGRIIRGEPQDTYRSGQFARVPIMIGANDQDIGFAPVVTTLREALAPFDDKRYQTVLPLYQAEGNTPQQVAQTLASDRFMVEPARYVASVFSRAGLPAWHYRFAYVADSMRPEWSGAVHASEIPYVFNTVSARYGQQLSGRDRDMARQVHQYWVNFARAGDPNGEQLPRWLPYQAEKDNLMLFPAGGAADSAQVRDPWEKRLNQVAALADEKS
ncbi:carboxylesterase family protein [Affinibrenneria salicis]|uniref:Carboxylic ester hydrolase n=2 Tax=Affinibrenneria salicis TaxID=2590031 RepID=A0A5J5FSE6_9GAMM|nr:carboxylesterase family protein [Affinibrenneria salicis]